MLSINLNFHKGGRFAIGSDDPAAVVDDLTEELPLHLSVRFDEGKFY
jgi:hypothetical protein